MMESTTMMSCSSMVRTPVILIQMAMDCSTPLIINEHYEQDKARLTKDEMKFGNMNYYLKKEEYIRKHLWKTEKEFNTDIIRAMKERIK